MLQGRAWLLLEADSLMDQPEKFNVLCALLRHSSDFVSFASRRTLAIHSAPFPQREIHPILGEVDKRPKLLAFMG